MVFTPGSVIRIWDVMSKGFLDKESNDFLDRMSNDFLDGPR